MTIRADMASLLTHSRSEAKRWQAQGPNLLVLALVVAQRHEDEFRATFGDGGRAELERRLAVGGTPADEEGVAQTLERASSAGGVAALVRDLHEMLSPPSANDDADPSTQTTPVSAADAESGSGDVVDGRISHLVRLVPPDPSIVGREDVVDDLLGVIGRRRSGVALVTGPPGSGRSALAIALATRLADTSYDGPLAGQPVLVADAAPLIEDGRARALRRVLDAIGEETGTVLVLDDADVLAAMTGQAVDLELLSTVLSAAKDCRLRLVLTMTATAAGRLAVHDAELAGRVDRLPLPALSPAVLRAVAATAAAKLAESHGVAVDEEVVALSTAPPRDADHWAHPGLAVRRLDASCVHARLRQADAVAPADLRLPGEGQIGLLSSEALADRLRRRVMGQDAAVTTVAQRLSLTRARLDLRPERPDGAFLFVGPTGVGKTELARAACAELFGDEQRLIRLDMSEYAHDWAVSRLVGPMPGYVGSTEPESWLTTRVRQQPETVVLLDEIEKAHPTVWNTFLQVLDAGRLTDSRGKVTDFSRTIVIMTSNLGARSFSSRPVGFDSADTVAAVAADRVLDSVKAAMAPELVNRLDALVVFHPLPRDTLFDIAAKEVGHLLDRLAAIDYRLTVEDEVVRHLATTGYDPAYGARHLHRNIERLLLQPLAERTDRRMTAQLVEDKVHWLVA